jgi:hypothetical protein
VKTSNKQSCEGERTPQIKIPKRIDLSDFSDEELQTLFRSARLAIEDRQNHRTPSERKYTYTKSSQSEECEEYPDYYLLRTGELPSKLYPDVTRKKGWWQVSGEWDLREGDVVIAYEPSAFKKRYNMTETRYYVPFRGVLFHLDLIEDDRNLKYDDAKREIEYIAYAYGSGDRELLLPWINSKLRHCKPNELIEKRLLTEFKDWITSAGMPKTPDELLPPSAKDLSGLRVDQLRQVVITAREIIQSRTTPRQTVFEYEFSERVDTRQSTGGLFLLHTVEGSKELPVEKSGKVKQEWTGRWSLKDGDLIEKRGFYRKERFTMVFQGDGWEIRRDPIPGYPVTEMSSDEFITAVLADRKILIPLLQKEISECDSDINGKFFRDIIDWLETGSYA